MIATPVEHAPEALEIDTWLLSCRVIGRRAENAMLEQLALRAVDAGFTPLRGTYSPTPKNGVVRDLYSALGFGKVERDGETTVWEYDLATNGVPANEFIAVT